MRFHCRCRKCDARRALPRHLDEYHRKPHCRVCGSTDLRPDKWMNERNTKAMTCTCDGHGPGYHHPHRRGSVWCYYQPSGEWKTDEQFAAEQALLREHQQEEVA